MRFNFRIKAGNITFFATISHTQTLEGVTSLVGRDQHIIMWVSDKMPSIIYDYLMFRNSINRPSLEDGEIWLSGTLVARGDALFERVMNFIEEETEDELNLISTKKILNKTQETDQAMLRLQSQLRNLILRIKHGKPLAGKCSICS